ncbi:MAG TPA: ANTAR domain-containing protein [Lachnospiraceae bacterium]|nr:ANTAR domain-containing protein [Lachnospiraceae bacterium]
MVNVIVVFPKIEDAQNIRNFLVRNGITVTAVCTSGAQVLQYADDLDDGIVVCGYKFTDMLYSQLREYLPACFDMLLVASQHLLQSCRDNDIVCVSMPIKAYDLVNTISMMSQTISRRRKKQNLKPKARNVEDKQTIVDAKAVLMSRNNMTEDEAHRYIQKCSMDTGTNMVETAQMVLTLLR